LAIHESGEDYFDTIYLLRAVDRVPPSTWRRTGRDPPRQPRHVYPPYAVIEDGAGRVLKLTESGFKKARLFMSGMRS
jgi:hypothetical protein